MGQPTQISLYSRRLGGKDRLVSVLEITPEFAARFELGPVIGTGAMGMVFSGTRLAGGTPCAIKFLTRLGDPEILSRFLQEGRVLAKIEHPHVVRLLEMDTLQGHPYIVTELLASGTLRQRLDRDGRLPLDEALAIASACLSALSACHAADVVHRDVKPENVLFDADGRARLVDFGIAKAYGADSHTTRAGVMIGTPRYMAPELLRGGKPTVSGDVYALGCTLYEMITGNAAFPQMSMKELLPQVMNQMPPPMGETVPDVPDWLEELVFRCLSKKADERPATAAEMAELLSPAPAEVPEAHAAAIPEEPAAGLGMRHLTAGLILLALALALARVAFGAEPPPGDRTMASGDKPPVICIDPGHPSEVSEGTRAADGTTEVHVAWEVALKLERLLTDAGYRVVKTKDAEGQLVKNRRRAEIANEADAALMVRLHCDAAAGSGFALYHPDRTGKTQGVTGPAPEVIASSGRAARALHEGMAAELEGELKDNGVKGDSKTFIGGKQGALTGSIFSKVPVVTIEMVVLTNASNASWIRTSDGQSKMARAIARGVASWTPPPAGPASRASRASPASSPSSARPDATPASSGRSRRRSGR